METRRRESGVDQGKKKEWSVKEITREPHLLAMMGILSDCKIAIMRHANFKCS